jgi:hypothetical protein
MVRAGGRKWEVSEPPFFLDLTEKNEENKKQNQEIRKVENGQSTHPKDS